MMKYQFSGILSKLNANYLRKKYVMKHSLVCSAVFAFLLSYVSPLFAQEKKADKKLKAAIEERLESDRLFTEVQRSKYSKDQWRRSWIGTKLSDLYKKWGAPTRSFPDENGGQIIVYETTSYSTGGTYKPGYSITESLTTQGGVVLQSNTTTVAAEDTRWVRQNIRSTNVYVNKEGIITNVTETYN